MKLISQIMAITVVASILSGGFLTPNPAQAAWVGWPQGSSYPTAKVACQSYKEFVA